MHTTESEPLCVCGHAAEEHDCIGPTSDCLNTRCRCPQYRSAEAALQETRETTDLADFDAPALRRLTLAMTGRRLPGVPMTHHRKENH